MRLCAEEKYGIWRVLNKELHFPLHGLPKVVSVKVSCGNQLEIREKKGRILNHRANAKQLTERNGNAQLASVKNGGKIVVISAVRISRKRDAKSLVFKAGCSSGIFLPFAENVFVS